MNKIIHTVIALCALPAILFVYNPSWQLGGLGMILGFIGYYISPLVILFLVVQMLKRVWR